MRNTGFNLIELLVVIASSPSRGQLRRLARRRKKQAGLCDISDRFRRRDCFAGDNQDRVVEAHILMGKASKVLEPASAPCASMQ